MSISNYLDDVAKPFMGQFGSMDFKIRLRSVIYSSWFR